MIENTSFRDGHQFAWDSTSLKLANECPRKYYYVMHENWTASNYSVHLIFGGHYARALETYHKRIAEGDDHEQALRYVVRQTLVESWNHNLDADGNRIPETGAPQEFLHSAKTREALIRTIIWYLEDPAPNITTYIMPNGKPAVELSFKIEIDDGNILCGHLDRVVDFGGNRFIQDQKTTSYGLSDYYFRKFDLDIQMSVYSIGARVLFASPAKGVMIDAAQIAQGYTKFLKGFTFRSPDVLDEFYTTTLARIKQIQQKEKFEDFEPNFTACENYGGCEFKSVCAASPAHREKVLKSEFTKRLPWDPMKSR